MIDSVKIKKMQRPLLFLTFLLVLCGSAVLFAQQKLDLSGIKRITPKGRIQDKDLNPKLPEIDDLITRGKYVIPMLIELLDDETPLPHRSIDYWGEVRTGDMALVILSDFFLDPKGRSTMPAPGLAMDELMKDISKDLSFHDRLYTFIEKNGRKPIKEIWQTAWDKHQNEIHWDWDQRCFLLKATRVHSQTGK